MPRKSRKAISPRTRQAAAAASRRRNATARNSGGGRGAGGWELLQNALHDGQQAYFHRGSHHVTLASGRDRGATALVKDVPVQTWRQIKLKEKQLALQQMRRFAARPAAARTRELNELGELVAFQEQHARQTHGSTFVKKAHESEQKLRDNHENKNAYRFSVGKIGHDERDNTAAQAEAVAARKRAIREEKKPEKRADMEKASKLLSLSASLEREDTAAIAGSHNVSDSAYAAHPTRPGMTPSSGVGASGRAHRARAMLIHAAQSAFADDSSSTLAAQQAARLRAALNATTRAFASPSTVHTNRKIIMSMPNSAAAREKITRMHQSREASKRHMASLTRFSMKNLTQSARAKRERPPSPPRSLQEALNSQRAAIASAGAGAGAGQRAKPAATKKRRFRGPPGYNG